MAALSDFFTPITNTKPYLKAAFEGFAGSGKTYTAGKLAIGLHKRIASTKPIALFDTERANKFLKPLFKLAGIECVVKESRSFTDLMTAMRLCREGFSDILIVDSITHVWENVLAEFMAEKKRTRLEFQDWGILKPLWKRQFSDPFVNDPYHFVMCGRAGFEYTDEKDEQGRRQIFKSGIKMKVEGETAYEPDLLVLMERYEEVLERDKVVYREAMILKDRSNTIDGKTFQFKPDDATGKVWDAFSPAVEVMLENPDYRVPVSGNDSLLFPTEEARVNYGREKDKMVEEIDGLLMAAWPGMTAEEKKKRGDLVYEVFNTRSHKAMEDLGLEQLQSGYDKIRGRLLNLGLVQAKPMPEAKDETTETPA